MAVRTSLRAAALQGSLWVLLGFGAAHGIRLAANLVLLWLLFPAAWGLMAIVNVILHGLTMFSDIGLGPSIIHNKRGDHPNFLRTAWTIQVVRGFVLWIAACALAWPIAAFYARTSPENWQLLELIPVAALSAVLAGFHSTALYTLNRRLQLGRLAMIELAAHVVGVIVMLAWALVYASVWALVVGGITMTAAKLVLSHVAIAEYRMGFQWDRRSVFDLFHYGKWIFVSTLLTFVATQGDRLLFGALVPTDVLGFYAIALMLALVPAEMVFKLGSRVVFPAYSRVHNSGASLADPFKRTRLSLLSLGGLATSLLVAAGTSIVALLDSRYEPVGWMLQILAIGSWFRVMEGASTSALLAIGKPSWLAAGSLGRILGLLAIVPIGYSMYGFQGALVCLVIADVLRYVVLAIGARRFGLPVLAGDAALIGWWCGATLVLYMTHAHLAGLGQSVPLILAVMLSTAVIVWLPPAALLVRNEFTVARDRVR